MDKQFNRYSIKNLESKMKNPRPKRKGQCLYLVKISKVVKDTTGTGSSYTNTYWQCNKIQNRIFKRSCANCPMYKRASDED